MPDTEKFLDGGVLGVFARPDHPIGYGFCTGETLPAGYHQRAKAHGYVIVVVMCRTWPELEDVKKKLASYQWDAETGNRVGAYDPWERGDLWYAGPYELVWCAQIDGKVRHATGMWDYHALEFGSKPSYGDNRAMAYLTGEQVLAGE